MYPAIVPGGRGAGRGEAAVWHPLCGGRRLSGHTGEQAAPRLLQQGYASDADQQEKPPQGLWPITVCRFRPADVRIIGVLADSEDVAF